MYIIGFTRSCPVLAPTVCRSSSGAPSNGPPTLPSLARNSSMILLFQSDISGTLILLSSAFAGAHRPVAALPCATGQPQPHAGSFPRRKEELSKARPSRLGSGRRLTACAGRGYPRAPGYLRALAGGYLRAAGGPVEPRSRRCGGWTVRRR